MRLYLAGVLSLVTIILLGALLIYKNMIPQAEAKILPAGRPLEMGTRFLSWGAALLQNHAPIKNHTMHLVGLHPMKSDPHHQMIAHHYCKQVNEDFAQCILFDGNTKNANLNGIEYIISAKIYGTLPAEERRYWHPHNYEVFSGQLNAPGIPEILERRLMKQKINSYGKTWHVWMTEHEGMSGYFFPLGEARLAWSLNNDNEANVTLLKELTHIFKINLQEKQDKRRSLKQFAEPQEGVDAISGHFR